MMGIFCFVTIERIVARYSFGYNPYARECFLQGHYRHPVGT